MVFWLKLPYRMFGSQVWMGGSAGVVTKPFSPDKKGIATASITIHQGSLTWFVDIDDALNIPASDSPER
jgi:dTDP-4-amino-4,6-dideoxygalactose transaminase